MFFKKFFLFCVEHFLLMIAIVYICLPLQTHAVEPDNSIKGLEDLPLVLQEEVIKIYLQNGGHQMRLVSKDCKKIVDDEKKEIYLSASKAGKDYGKEALFGNYIGKLRALEAVNLRLYPTVQEIQNGLAKAKLNLTIPMLKQISSQNLSIKSMRLALNGLKIDNNVARALVNQIKAFVSLTSLDLKLGYGPAMSNKGLITLGESLSELPNLRSLSLDLRKTLKRSVIALLKSFSNLLNLTSLSLRLNSKHIFAESVIALVESLRRLPNLRSLNLSLRKINIGAASSIALVESLSQLPKFSSLSLDFSYSNMGRGGEQRTIALVKSLRQLPNLSSLSFDFSYSNIGAASVVALVEILGQLPNLRSLSLNLNRSNIGAASVVFLVENLSQLLNLRSLSLYLISNNINAASVVALGNSLSTLKHLEHLSLYLSGNNIPAKDLIAILLKSLSELPNLRSLSLGLRDTNMRDTGVIGLAESLSAFKHLTHLDLDLDLGGIGYECLTGGVRNYIGEQGVIAIGEGLSVLVKLRSFSLDLFSRDLSDQAVMQAVMVFGESFSKLKHLTDLHLSFLNNNIGKEGLIALFKRLSKLENLTRLQFDLDDLSIGLQGQLYYEDNNGRDVTIALKKSLGGKLWRLLEISKGISSRRFSATKY